MPKMKKVVPKNCLECEHHRRESDADPKDWFRDNDFKIVCSLNDKDVARRIEPFDDEEALCKTPSWCPLR